MMFKVVAHQFGRVKGWCKKWSQTMFSAFTDKQSSEAQQWTKDSDALEYCMQNCMRRAKLCGKNMQSFNPYNAISGHTMPEVCWQKVDAIATIGADTVEVQTLKKVFPTFFISFNFFN